MERGRGLSEGWLILDEPFQGIAHVGGEVRLKEGRMTAARVSVC